MTQPDPVTQNLTYVTVVGRFTTPSGEPVSGGALTFTPVFDGRISDADENTYVADVPIVARIDSDGEFSVRLLASDDDDLNPTGWYYAVEERIAGANTSVRRYNITLTEAMAPEVELAELAPTSGSGSPPPVTYVSSVDGQTGHVTLTNIDHDITLGDGSPARSLHIQSSYAGGQDVSGNPGRADSTGRINFYHYQQALIGSYGEPLRFHMRKRDAKAMLTWKGPTSFTEWSDPDDPQATGGDPIGGDRNWAWCGAHYEANNHDSVHGHWSIETPDAANGYLQTRFEILIWDTRDPDNITFGLDKTLIATNQADLVVRAASGGQFLRFSGNGAVQRGMEFTRDVWGASRLWKLVTNDSTVSTNGANTGAELQIRRYDDNNIQLGTPLTIYRDTGNVKWEGRVGMGTDPGATIRLTATNSGSAATIFASSTTASDTNLQPVVGVESVDATNRSYGARLAGDTSYRFVVFADGKIEVGDGTTRDTNLYRSAANQWKTDDSLIVAGRITAGAGTLSSATVNGQSDGANNVALFQATAVGSASLGVVAIVTPDTSKRGLDFRVNADSVSRLRVDCSATGGAGTIVFGNGTTADTNLYRSAADTLKTDDSMVVGGNLTVTGNLSVTGTYPGSGGGSAPTYDNYVAAGTPLATLNTLIDTLSTAGGGRILLGPGTHTFNGSIVLKDNVFIAGVGIEGTVVNQTSTTAACFSASGQRRFGVEKLYINGPGSGTGHAIQLLKGANPDVSHFYLRDMVIGDFGGDGVNVENGIVSDISGVQVQNCGGWGFHIYGQSAGAAGTSVKLNYCYGNDNNTGNYRIYKMTYMELSTCASDNAPRNYVIEDSQGIALTGCGVEVTTGPCFEFNVSGSAGCHVTATGCWSYQKPQQMFKVTNGARAVLIGNQANSPAGGAWVDCDGASKVIDIGPVNGGSANAGTTANIVTTNFA